MPTEQHERLVEIGRKYLLTHQICGHAKSSIVTTEINIACGESPDVLGFSGCTSFLIEAKQSRSDFKKDHEKWFRKLPEYGMGDYRMYITPKGLIKPDELPQNWGLIEVNDKGKCRMIVKPVRVDCQKKGEFLILTSIIRRIGQTEPEGVSIKCYKYETKNTATLTIKEDER